MNLFTGHYNQLKTALTGFINSAKTQPLDKVLLVLPSGILGRQLKAQLSAQNGCIGALYTVSFFELAKNIYAANANAKPILRDDNLHNFILKNIQQKFGGNANAGYITALKSTLKDLLNAKTTPADLLAYINDTAINLTDAQRLHIKTLAVVYDEYLNTLEKGRHISYGSFMQTAANTVAGSEYLGKFKHIIFYGFYDLTGLQLDLLGAMRQNYQINFFMPYEDKPAYHFCKSFYELQLLPYAKTKTVLPPPGSPLAALSAGLFDSQAKPSSCCDIKIINTAGAMAELEAAAKEVLHLTQAGGLAFSDIAVTSRSMDNYKDDVFNVFYQNKIPLNTALNYNITANALGAFVLNLLSLAANNFNRDAVLAVVCAPYFNRADRAWVRIVKQVGIEGGFNQWAYLLPCAQKDGIINPAAQLLLAVLSDIKHNLDDINKRASFSELAQKTGGFIEICLNHSALEAEDKAVLQQIFEALKTISTFDSISPFAAPGEFAEELLQILNAISFARVNASAGGLTVADSMTLRGQAFKAIIILGLNEGIFPSATQEDPILKDNFRIDLQKIGHWILQKADRYREERLLFYFALSCASAAACLIYQRADYNGKPKIPSIYISGEVLRLLGQDLNNNHILIQSRRPFEKYANWDFKYLNRMEAALAAAVYAQDKPAALAAILVPQNEDQFLKDIYAAAALNIVPSLSIYDGQLGKGNAVVQKLSGQGTSPSALRILYDCPARFMFDFITGGHADEPLNRAVLAAKTTGNIYHKILEDFYKYIKEHNLLNSIFNTGGQDILAQTAAVYLAETNYKKYGMYPLIWQRTAKEILATLSAFVQMDLQALQQSGFAPQFFEEKLQAEIEIQGQKLKIRGIFDRVDIAHNGQNYQITDYKKRVLTPDVKKGIFKDGNLQPPLYFELAQASDLLKDKTPASMQLLDITANKPRPLAYDDYLAFKDKFTALMLLLLKIVQDGDFIITPNKYCANCPYNGICRKQNQNTAVRNTICATALKLKDYHAT